MTSLEIAKKLNMQHFSIIRLVEYYVSYFNEFGKVEFIKTTPNSRGGRPLKYAILNNLHEEFLILLLKNNDKTVQLKKDIFKKII